MATTIATAMVSRMLMGKTPRYSQLGTTKLWLLLLGIIFAIAPHFLRLPIWLPSVAAIVLLWRLAAERWHWPMPGSVLRLLLAAAGFVAVAFSYGRPTEAAAVALLITMLVLKLTESAALRDGLVAAIFALFAVAAQALYSQSIVQTVWILFALAWLLTVQLAFTHEGLSLSKAGRGALALLAQSLPVALLLFVLFPRLPGPLWGIGLDKGAYSTGLADELRLGDISSLAQSSAVAFRVQWPGKAPAARELYWRGPVLWDYDGSQWRKGREPQPLSSELADDLQRLLARQAAVNYEVFLEPHEKRWLFALDMPAPLQGLSLPEGREAKLSDQLQWFSDNKVIDPMRYSARSFLGSRVPVNYPAAVQNRALRLPAGYNPKTRALGERWAAQYRGREIIDAAQRWYVAQQFRYTLEPSPLGVDQLDDFLFSNKNGFCAHFASSFAVLMRAAGLPSRLVAGYQGGEVNPLAEYDGDYMVVRQSQAHLWVEVWLPNEGWLRVDPTGWAAPGRLIDGIADTLPAENSVPSLFSLQSSVFGRLRLNYDLLNYRWQRLVLSYDGARQMNLLGKLHPWLANIGNLIALCGVLLAVLAVSYSSYLLWRDRRKRLAPAQKLWRQLQKRLAKVGLQQGDSETAQAFARRAGKSLPANSEDLLALARQYAWLRYSKSDEDTAAFERRLKSLRLKPESEPR